MSGKHGLQKPNIPTEVNFTSAGQGRPVILIHGLAASLHDWDMLVPELVAAGYRTYAPDLLGHGASPKPEIAAYEMDWLVDHFADWLNGLELTETPVLIGHSLGGYVALEYARRHPERLRGLVLVDPFYSSSQLPAVSRWAYAHPRLSGFFVSHSPAWLVKPVVDLTSLFMGHRTPGMHALSAEVRAQTALDYLRTAPAVYAILKGEPDLRPYLGSIGVPTLVVWGEQDRTLSPASFPDLIKLLPTATGRSSRTGHVPHQADAGWFGEQVLAFLASLPGAGQAPKADKLGERAENQSTRGAGRQVTTNKSAGFRG